MDSIGTYVYCIVADSKPPRRSRRRAGLQGLGPVRLLPVGVYQPSLTRRRGSGEELQMWAVAADAPLDHYSEAAINRGLSDLDWVSRAAVAHERVVESFITAPAVLPMKLFTIFTNDARALAYVAREGAHIQAVLKRVRGQHEWGVRVRINRERAISAPAKDRPSRAVAGSGARYLQRKRAQHQAVAGLAARSRDIAADLHDQLSRDATMARRRSGSELPAEGAPLLLEAAYLVPRTLTAKFQSDVARQARALVPQGYDVTLSGPWPPYTFMQD